MEKPSETCLHSSYFWYYLTVYASSQNSIPPQHLWSLIRAIKEYKDAIMTTLKGSHPFSSDGVTSFNSQDYGGASVLNEGEEGTRS